MAKASAESIASRGRNTPLAFVAPEDVVLVEDRNAILFDERVFAPIDAAHVANVRHYGIIEPVVARRNGGTIEIIDGRQRVRWAREANRLNRECGHPPLRLPVVFRHAEDSEAKEVSISANEVRYPDSLTTKARKAQRLASLGYNQREIGRIFGVGSTAVCQWLKLLHLTPDLQVALDQGDLRVDVARRLCGLPRAEQAAAIDAVTRECICRSHQTRPASDEPTPPPAVPCPEPAPAAAPAPATNGHARRPKNGAAGNGRAHEPTGDDADAQHLRRTCSRIRDLSVYVTEVNRGALEPAWSLLLLWLIRDRGTTDGMVAAAFPTLAPFFTWRSQRGE